MQLSLLMDVIGLFFECLTTIIELLELGVSLRLSPLIATTLSVSPGR
jgi:hypothetical protein